MSRPAPVQGFLLIGKLPDFLMQRGSRSGLGICFPLQHVPLMLLPCLKQLLLCVLELCACSLPLCLGAQVQISVSNISNTCPATGQEIRAECAAYHDRLIERKNNGLPALDVGQS